MLDCWTGIDILLFLQTIRESVPAFITNFFLMLSNPYFYRGILMMPFVLLYWFVSKKKGELGLLSLLFTGLINNMTKFVVKQPRPYVLDPEIHPVVIDSGYSFPSSHSSVSTVGLVLLASIVKKLWVRISLIVVLILIMFSRMWLGSHTPIDVTVGFILGIVVMAINWYFIEKSYENDRNYYNIGLFYIAAFAVICMVLANVVDRETKHTYYMTGLVSSLLIFRLVERRYIAFEIEKNTLKNNVILAIIGFTVIFALYGITFLFDLEITYFVTSFLINLWVIVLYPYLMKNRVSFRPDSAAQTLR